MVVLFLILATKYINKIYKRINDFLRDLSKKIKQYNPNKAHIFNSIKMIQIYGDCIIRPLKLIFYLAIKL